MIPENSNGNDSSYEFISETRKKRPVNKRRIFLKTLFTIFLGVLFGAVACVTYVLLLPRVEEYFYNNQGDLISLYVPGISNDSVKVDETESPEAAGAPEEKKGSAETLTAKDNEEVEETAAEPEEIKEETETEAGEPEKTSETHEKEEKKDPPKEETEEIKIPESESIAPKDGESIVTVSGSMEEAASEPMAKQLEIEDYTLLYQKIGSVAEEVKKAIVTVTGVSSENEWFNTAYESKNKTTGLILADNGKELLILTRTSVVQDADKIQVTFGDDTKLEATLKKADENTGLSVVAVELSALNEETGEGYQMAELGNSRAIDIKGKPVIAIGDPLGVSDSIAIGQITSDAIIIDKTDTNVGILTTDIYGSINASGILCDFDGKVLGIICHDGNTSDTKNLIRGYSISDIKAIIEKLLNGQDIAFLGIQGTDVTQEISEQYNIPKGAYVKVVVPDSPAMKAGIQNGDVIVKLGTNDIYSFSDYKEAMLKCQPKDTTAVTVKRLGREEYVDISYEVVLGKL